MRINRIIRTGVALVFVVAVGACGDNGRGDENVASVSGAKSGDGADAKKSAEDPEEAALAFARCMRKQGVDFPDPQTNGQGVVRMGPDDRAPAGFDEDEMASAHEKCKHLLPDGGGLDSLSPEQKAEMQDQMVKFASCMREHGVDMPDPDPDKGGIVVERGSADDDLDMQSEQFKAAEDACRDLLRPPGGGPVARSEGGTGGSSR